MYRLLLVSAVALTLTAAGCATPPAEKSAGGAASGQAAGDANGAGGGKKQPWWRLSQYSRTPAVLTPEEKFRQRPGLISGKEGGIVLYRQGEGGSSDPSKPRKARR
ncbi:MAG: hypothetical protein F4114_17460 [Rhodospirillaceae bacterium]|nr:hypothetical protein [Rhodospirillaceae bacterium]MYB13007.1 hypothetical protein [Rhodospirillaceae bacterium]MYI50857.1 hypothetical protein [Rhodospirillaceae bacterium]